MAPTVHGRGSDIQVRPLFWLRTSAGPCWLASRIQASSPIRTSCASGIVELLSIGAPTAAGSAPRSDHAPPPTGCENSVAVHGFGIEQVVTAHAVPCASSTSATSALPTAIDCQLTPPLCVATRSPWPSEAPQIHTSALDAARMLSVALPRSTFAEKCTGIHRVPASVVR